MRINRYHFVLHHDKGTKKISLVGTSRKATKEVLMKVEGCPERAIKYSHMDKL